LERVTENLNRTKLTAKVIASDIVRWAPDKPVDMILLDAPCSATGTIRRHPDLPFGKSGDLKPILRLQQKLLSRAFEWLKPGGKIVYCTCSLLPSEGEEQIVKFLQNHDDAKQLPANTYVPDLPEDWMAPDGGLRLRPDFWAERGGMDGFYATIIEKSELIE
jgi:16S rRNA (cytosine967-C5)-methyltransferase